MPSSYTRLKDDDESAGKIINAIIALIMELPCFIFIYVPNGYWILCGIFFWFWFAATIGDALRQYTKPSAFWSKSSVSAILDTEIYWKIGPQIKAIGYAYIILIAAFFYVVGTDLGDKIIGDETVTKQTVTTENTKTDNNSDNTTSTPSSESSGIQYRD